MLMPVAAYPSPGVSRPSRAGMYALPRPDSAWADLPRPVTGFAYRRRAELSDWLCLVYALDDNV